MRHHRLLALLALPCLLLAPAPARAASPDPAVALGLTMGVPLGLAGTAGLLALIPRRAPFQELQGLSGGVLTVAMVSAGIGHLYAGDPQRAAAVSVGWPLVMWFGGLATAMLVPVPKGRDANSFRLSSGMAGAGLIGIAYLVAAGLDASQVAARSGATIGLQVPLVTLSLR